MSNYFIDGGNPTPHDVNIGSVVTSKENVYDVTDERWIGTGMFNSGYQEFFIEWRNPPEGRRSSGWISSYIIDKDCEVCNENALT